MSREIMIAAVPSAELEHRVAELETRLNIVAGVLSDLAKALEGTQDRRETDTRAGE